MAVKDDARAPAAPVRLYENLRTIVYAPFYLADLRGHWARAGADVRVELSARPAETAEGLLAGRVDVSWGGPMRVMMHHDRDRDCPLVCFGQVVARDPFLLVGREPNAAFRFADLAGLRVAVAGEVPTPWMTFQDDLARAGLDPATIRTLPDAPMAESYARLLAGEVDVIQVLEPYATLAVRAGAGHIWHRFAARGDIGYTTFYTTRRFAGSRPEVCRGLVQGIARALAELRSDPIEAIAADLAGHFPDLERDVLAGAVEGYRRSGLWARSTDLPAATTVRLKAALLSGGLITRDIPHDAFVLPDLPTREGVPPMPPSSAVPTIDIAPFLAGDPAGRAAVARAFRAACEDMGFVVISGHGIPRATIEGLIERGYAFFDQPAEIKARWHPTGPARQRGYHGMATRGLSATLGKDAPKDLRESVFLGPLDDHRAAYAHLPEAATAYAPNLVPTEPAGIEEALTGMYRAFERLAADLLRIFAVALDLDEDHFAPLIDRHFSVLSAHHYPALTAPPLPGQLRTGAHTDYGALTILAMTQSRGGLEVQAKDGTWAPVAPAPGDLVVNLGDMMQRWTNDRWRSTMHRVATPEDLNDAMSRRMSVGYFMHPNYDAEIRCIPTCLAPGEAPRYAPITAGGHIRAKIEASHGGGSG